MKLRGKWTRKHSYHTAGIMVAAFMVIAAAGFWMVRSLLLENAQRLGNELANQYAELELQDVRSAELLLTAGVWTMEDLEASGADADRVEEWAQNYFQETVDRFPNQLVPYAVIDGKVITPDGESDRTLEEMPWGDQVERSEGETRLSSMRTDSEYGQIAIVVSRKCAGSSDALVFELYLGTLHGDETESALPEGSSYYLCNPQGDLIYARTQLDATPEELQQYVTTILGQIKAGNLDDAQEYVYDLTHDKRAVYFYTHESGGVSIITVSYSSLLRNLDRVFFLIMSVSSVALLFLIFLGVWERHLQKKLSRVNETVAALGNLYYAIYRINWKQGTYEFIKESEEFARQVPAEGQYEQFLEVARQLIEPEAYPQFETSFSLENMRRLVEDNVSDFGGDFRRRFGDEYRWVNVRLLFDPSLRQNEAILCFRLVDQEKSSQLQHLRMLEEALDDVRESEASQEKFFSQMSHDMRTPLSVIMASVELARQQEGDWARTDDYLRKIQVSADQLMKLINSILEMSRMEKTELILSNDPCDLREMVSECLSPFQAQADLQHKTLEVTFDLRHPRVYVDTFRLQQILNNLVSNAMKFTREGDSVRVEVTQSDWQEEEICRIVVQDTGVGISPEFLPQLFTPYARENRFGTQTVIGTGLGMAIVKTIVTRMKGQIQVESTPDVGTTFTLTIPMEPVPEQPVQTEAEPEKRSPAEVLGGKRVLLAEDYEMNLEIGTELLKLCGAEVIQARDGQEAVRLFRESEPGWFDVILMDMNMPVMDGCAAAAAIRAMDREDAATVPIIAVTANAFSEDMVATARAGMNAHITKPIDLQELADRLEQLKR